MERFSNRLDKEAFDVAGEFTEVAERGGYIAELEFIIGGVVGGGMGGAELVCEGMGGVTLFVGIFGCSTLSVGACAFGAMSGSFLFC